MSPPRRGTAAGLRTDGGNQNLHQGDEPDIRVPVESAWPAVERRFADPDAHLGGELAIKWLQRALAAVDRLTRLDGR
jgi:hypothetical protein